MRRLPGRCRACGAVLTVLALLLASCARAPRAPTVSRGPEHPVSGGTLRVIGFSDVDHLFTASSFNTSSTWLFSMTARQLLTCPSEGNYEAKTQVVPDAAREVPTTENGGISPDGRRYTFHLKRGLRWNSTPVRAVTASDFIRGFKLLCNPVSPAGPLTFYTDTISGLAPFCEAFAKVPGTVEEIKRFVAFHEIEGVHAPDDTTLVIDLLTPAPDFLKLVTLPATSAVPVEYLEYLPDGPEFRRHTLSDGPYAIVRYDQNRAIELERNPAWDPATDPRRPAHVDRISIGLGFDDGLVQLQIEAGTADLSFDMAMLTANQASLRAMGDARVKLSPDGDHYGSFHYLCVNVKGPNDALRRHGVREAIALAVDKRALRQLSGGPGVSRPLYQAVPSTVTGFRPGADRWVTPGDRGDPSRARRLLAAAGLPDGLRLRLPYPTDGTFPIEAQSLQASLHRAGLEAELVPYVASDYWGRLLPNPECAARGEWDVALASWVPDWFGDNGRDVISPLFDGRQRGNVSYNYGGFNDSAVNAAIDRALAARGLDAAEAAWADATAIVNERLFIVPLFERKNGWMHSSRVRNCQWLVGAGQCDPTVLWLEDADAD